MPRQIAPKPRNGNYYERVVVAAVAQLVKVLPQGNPFSHANKALDHFFAYGPRAADAPPPRIYAGGHLPAELIRAAGEVLSREGLMPAKGYLAGGLGLELLS